MLHHDPFSDCTEHVVEVLEAHALRLDMIVNNGRSLTAICAQRLGTPFTSMLQLFLHS